MPRRVLTDRFCQHAKAAEGEAQTDFYDDDYPGLALRVSARTKAWRYHFIRSGGRVQWTFGTYPATSLAKARTIVDEARVAIEDGRDPRTVFAKPETLKAICEEWADREAAGLRTGDTRKATLERLVYPTLGDRPINDIRRSEIVRLLDRVEDESGPAAADKTLAFIRRVLNWHASRSDDFRTPIVPGMSRTKPRERARARTLTDDEIRVVWKVSLALGTFGRLVRFLLLTSARRNEGAQATWGEIDGSDWTLPAARNKTKVDLIRPLSKAALETLPEKPKGANEAAPVFSTDGKNPISGFSKFKLEFDKAVTAELRKHDPNAEPMPNWTLHDLRRTARSLMSRAKVPTDHAERVLGHVIGGIRGVYDLYEYRDEKRDALAALARLIDRIIAGQPTELRLVRITRDADTSAG
jgi:integrase